MDMIEVLPSVKAPKHVKGLFAEWQAIETAPKDGREIIAIDADDFIFKTAYRPTVVAGSGFGAIDSCCGFYEDKNPTHWMDLPEPPDRGRRKVF